jgi:hypothetical protein
LPHLRASSSRSRRLAAAGGLLIAGILAVTPACGAAAKDSVETVVWMHPDPAQLAKFKVYFSFDEDDHEDAQSVDVGLPVDERGLFSWTVTVPEQGFVYVAVQAVDRQGRGGDLSSWRRIDWDPQKAPLDQAGQPFLVAPSSGP